MNGRQTAEKQSLMNFFNEIINEQFYGEISIKLEAGKIVIIKKTQNIKIPETIQKTE